MNVKNLLILLSVLVCFNSNSQDTIRLVHTNYTSVFSLSKKHPVLVEWWVTKAKVDCKTPLKRKDNFKPDPLLSEQTNLSQDYVNSGFDRGHIMPAADNLCQTQKVLDECFYFSNMTPQYHSLNAGDWKSLETFVRNESKIKDSIKVWAGNLGEIKKIGRVSVPEYCWKVIYIKKDKKFVAFLFKNEVIKQDGFENNEIPLERMEKLTKMKFSQ
jgi:endonuclease G